VLGVCAITAPLPAQSLAGSATAYPVTRRVSYLGIVREQTGTWIGAEGSVSLGKVALGLGGFLGKVSGDPDPTTNPDLDMRVSDLWVAFRAMPWLDLGGTLEVRRQESSVGVNSWRLIGPTARATPGLGVSWLTGLAEVTYFVSASDVGSGAGISPALRATFGAAYAPPPGHFELRVAYRFERFDFAAVGINPARLEQFSGVLARVGLKVGRSR
jgi:hypothetical protein